MKNKKVNNRGWNSIKRFLSMAFKQNKAAASIAFIGMIIVSVLGLIIPQVTRMILDDAISEGKIKLLLILISTYVLIIILSSILEITIGYIYSKIKNNITRILKIKILKHLGNLSGSYYTDMETGNLMGIVEGDIYNVQNFGVDLVFSIIADVIKAVATIFLLARIQMDLFLLIIVLQSLLIFFQTKFTKIIAVQTNELRNSRGDLLNNIHEYISNIMNIVMSKSIVMFFQNYIKRDRKLIKNSIKLDMLFLKNTAVSKIMSNIIVISTYGYGGVKIIRGQMTLGELIAFQQYVGMFIGPCMNIIRSNNQIQQAAVSLDRIYGILDEQIVTKQNFNGKKCSNDFKGEIVFDRVTFSYGYDNNVLDSTNLKFENGKTTAIVGTSGSGKSTIARVLFRLWDIDNGVIRIDDVPLEEYNLKSIRKKISIITQELMIFDDSILNNIVLGKRNVSEEYLEDLCRKVGIYDFVMSLPDGFDTIVGEKGVKLSGGQKQRIAIARALLNQSKIIVFDEATSALDNISQKDILKNIEEFLVDRTTIVIAHRLSTVKDVDKIYVIDHGRVVEEGRHSDLMENRGVYFNFYNAEGVSQ